MLATLALAALALPQGRIPGQEATLSMYAYMPGQREVVMGVGAPYAETQMQVIHQTDAPPAFPAGGGTVQGGGLFEEALGWVRWSVKDDTFAGKPCKVLKCMGQTTEKITKTLQVTLADTSTYWVDSDGHILRQYNQQQRPFRTRTANCVFQKDSIDVSVDDERGRRAMSLFPNVDMELLHNQFKPMVVDGKVVLEQKEFAVFDPFTNEFNTYTVRLSGSVVGSYFAMKFEGKAFAITGPRLNQTVAISKEGDMIKVELPKDRFIVMQNVPNGKQKSGG